MRDLSASIAQAVARWPTQGSAVAVVDRDGVVVRVGGPSPRPWASVTKVLTALTVLDLVVDGLVALEEPVGPPGSTVRHLLAHASGLAVEAGEDGDRVLAAPGLRRIYSNRGFEVLGQLVARRSGTSYAEAVRARVLDPLAMSRTTCDASPAHGASGPVEDLARLAHELLAPHVLRAEVVRTASTPAYPALAGVLPGFGRQDPNLWGLGLEVRGHKEPHWTSPHNHPRSFGHFGQSGSFLWVDPVAGLACCSVGGTRFGEWATHAWPELSTLVLADAVPTG